ncbi:MAG: hypothetical protein ACK4WK_05690 [Anaerolineae bacterium]
MTEPREGEKSPVQCACVSDPFALLPPEMRPRSQKKSSLRKATCPGCGLVFWTNRETDYCMECEKKLQSGAAR